MATPADAAAVLAIYAPYVQTTAISFELAPPTLTEMQERLHKTLALHPWLVYETADQTIGGYVYATRHRERAAYQWSVDVSAYLDPKFHGQGLGRKLYTTLFALLRLQGFVSAYAGVALPNAASVGLHQAVGFQAVGVYQKVGYKLGRWYDVAWWHLLLQEPLANPQPPQPLTALPGWQAALLEA
ncbi:MAG: N-acetyltransferase [Anaerolineae bacterium]|nr:N-acetyltransferase [Anaerolineae bacterium]